MINKTFRLFVSSTFNDFLQERAILDECIFPEIDAYCQQRGYNFQLIDLRWGITNESAINQKTMEICLDEVKRCRLLSPKPNFLLMIGERYGWIPLPTSINSNEFKQIINVAEKAECEIISKWYELDENEIGGVYYLKARTGKYIDYDEWIVEETAIHNALVSCSTRMNNMSYETQKMLSSSATEREIIEGLLSNDDICDNTIAVFRNGYTDKDSDLSKINDLRDRIIGRMSEDGCEDNLLTLSWDDEYAEQFKERVLTVLRTNIDKEIIRLERVKEEIDQRDTVLQQYLNLDIVVNRQSYLDKIVNYTKSNDNRPMFVIGDSGSGKTTLLAEYIEQDSTSEVFFAFYGLDESSYLYIDCLKSISNNICEKYQLANTLDITEFNLTESVYDLIALLPNDKNVVIIIDGLDMFQDIGEIHESLVPDNLPSNVKMIISCATGKIADRFIGNGIVLSLNEFTGEESIEYFRSFLKQKNRVIVPEAQNSVIIKAIKDGVTPLHLKIVSNICFTWRSSELVKDLPQSADKMALQYMENMFDKFGHNRELVLSALSLIATSPYGITEEELQLLLLRFPGVRSFFITENRYQHDMTKLPFVIWSRLFYDLKGCLTLIKDRGYIVVRFAHNIFQRIFVERYSEYVESAQRLLVDYYTLQDNTLVNSQFPNTRKTLVLIYLLKKMNRIQEMADLLTDLSFVDAVLKTGRIDSLIRDYNYLISRIENIKSETIELYQIYSCLRDHREMLSCYMDEFYSCAAENGLKDTKTVFTLQKDQENTVKNNSLVFPYSPNVKIEWNMDASKYAVFYKSYVYICDAATGSEICRVFVQPKQVGFQNNILRVLWISAYTIAVAIYNSNIYFFDICDESPNAIDIIETEYAEEDDIKIIERYDLFLFKHKKQILAYEVKEGQEIKKVYSIDVPHNGTQFDVAGDEIFFKNNSRSISVCSVESGNPIRKVKLNNMNSISSENEGITGSALYKIDEKIWLEQSGSSLSPSFYIYDMDSRSKKKLVLPLSEYGIGWLVGCKKVLFYEDNIILLVSLKDYSLKYYKGDNIRSVAWVHEDYEISVISNEGLNRIQINEFQNLYDGPAYIFTQTKSRFAMTGLFDLISAASQMIRPLIGSGRKSDFWDYDEIFSSSVLDMEKDLRKNVVGTIVEISDRGTKAIVFEEKNTIAVYDKENKLISVIKNLKLGIGNSLLKIEFIKGYDYLLVWCNYYLKVFDVFHGKVLISLNLKKRPLLNLRIDEITDAILLTFYNEQEVAIDIRRRSWLSEIHRIPIYKDEDQYFGPYYSYETENGKMLKHMLDWSRIANDKVYYTNTARMLKDTFVYRSENYQLLYKNGSYIFISSEAKFDNNLKYFLKSELIEQTRDESRVRGFLRRKNDLFSKLYEFDGECLVLVARSLNSLIAFDIKAMKVLAAYKINGNIIGCTRDGKDITLILDRSPYQMRFTVSL